MGSEIFLTLLKRQIDIFVATFQNDATSLFKNEQNALIHPGEYGMYRERSFCALLRTVLTRDCSLSDGFIFSAENSLSTQCDILIKDALSMPLTDSGIAKFHPVEDVYAIVEMKSNLTKEELTTALRKLAQVKMIGDDRRTRRDFRKPDRLASDTIPTFLVCNKLTVSNLCTLDFSEIFSEIYDGIDQKYWHNAILSVEDGLFFYHYQTSRLSSRVKSFYPPNEDIPTPFPQHTCLFDDGTDVLNCTPFYVPTEPTDKYAHIIQFLSHIAHTIDRSVKHQFDSVRYTKPYTSDS